MHEIITLQFGQQANYVGTHFWNIQESYFTYSENEPESAIESDVHFRPGIAPDGTETYTPRALIYDLKDAFGTLRRINALYEATDPNSDPNIWSNDTVIRHALQPIPEHPYQQHLNSGASGGSQLLNRAGVRYWSDYNRVFYHPKSLNQVNEYALNDSLMPFERFETGEELFKTLDAENDLTDRDLRPFLEECDQLQGFQILTGADDAWAGFASRWLERMRDEYGKNSIWVWGCEDATEKPRERKLLQISNFAKSVSEIAANASVYVPLSNIPSKRPQYLHYEASSPWHTSALQATMLESMTLPTRLRSSDAQRTSLLALEEVFNKTSKRKIARAAFSIGKVKSSNVDFHMNGASTNGVNTQDYSEDLPHIDDIDLFHPNQGSTQSMQQDHLFGRADSVRSSPTDLTDDRREPRRNDRLGEEPSIKK